MAIKLLKIKPWGPTPLRSRLAKIESAINERTPRPGIGINIDEKDTGAQISTKLAQPAVDVGLNTASVAAGGSTPAPSGSYTVIATEFVNASNAGTAGQELLYGHGIGANRLVNNGDAIRATYGVNIESGSDSSNLTLFFGGAASPDQTIVDGNNLNLDADLTVKIEALLMRVNANTFRIVASLLASTNFADTSLDTQFVRSFTGADITGPSFANDRFLTLWGGGERVSQITARMALIEYVPA